MSETYDKSFNTIVISDISLCEITNDEAFTSVDAYHKQPLVKKLMVDTGAGHSLTLSVAYTHFHNISVSQ